MIPFDRDADIPAAELVAGNPAQRGLTLLDEPAHGLSAGLWIA